MNVDQKIDTIKTFAEEIIGLDELKAKLDSNQKLIAYDGFEPSGRIHIAQGLMRVILVNKLISLGIDVKILVADWLAYANNKMGGNLDHIKETGKYYIEVWKSCGLDTSKVHFLWTSDLVKDDKYWFLVMQIAKNTTLQRIIRCSQVMGRSEKDVLSAAQILYPAMQAADAFYIGANINQMGLDQRKVNILVRQIAEELGYEKPIAIHHHMLVSLLPPPKDFESIQDKVEQAIVLKMSKSKPDSAIFMSDSETEVADKISRAYCPPNIVDNNPVLEYFHYIVFERFSSVTVKREARYGGDVTYQNYAQMETDFKNGKLFPLDVKNNLITYINQLLQQSRDYFNSNLEAKALQERVIELTQLHQHVQRKS